MNTQDLINAYPFWGPANNGPAKNFAAPYRLVEVQVLAKVKNLQHMRVPQELDYNHNQVMVRQAVPAYVPNPQAPVQGRDPFAQSRSLTDYANQTLGTVGVANIPAGVNVPTAGG